MQTWQVYKSQNQKGSRTRFHCRVRKDLTFLNIRTGVPISFTLAINSNFELFKSYINRNYGGIFKKYLLADTEFICHFGHIFVSLHILIIF